MENSYNNNDEIDLKNIFSAFRRNAKKILFLSSISTVVIFSYLNSLKPLWRGSFNIVVKTSEQTNSPNNLSSYQNILSFKKNTSNETEKLILQSPLVLKPVYEYVLEYQKNQGNSTEASTFKRWLSTFKIDFKSNSNVLNITHDNKDKVLLLDTLNLISEKYREYSKKDQTKNILNTKKYLETQKDIMTKKYANSQLLLNQFSLENRLGNFDGIIPIENYTDKKNYEDESSKNRNENLGGDAASRYDSQFTRLNNLEVTFTNLSKYLKPSSKSLQLLKEEIDFLKESLKRPTEILLKYQELSAKALRDAYFLSNIENNLELTTLELVKSPDPWELISKPTLEKDPISLPIYRKFGTSVIISILLAAIIILTKEKFTGLIFNKSELENKLNTPYLDTISSKEVDLSTKLLLKYSKGNISGEQNQILGIINYESKANIDFLKNVLSKFPFVNFLDFSSKELDNCKELLIIIEKGKLTTHDIFTLNQYITLNKEKVVGWFYVG